MIGCPVAADTARYYARQDRAEAAEAHAIRRARADGCPECGGPLDDYPDDRDVLRCVSQAVTPEGPCDGALDLDDAINGLESDPPCRCREDCTC